MNAGIDPGRWKTGVAFEEDGRLLFSAIVPQEKASVLCSAFSEGRWEPLAQWRAEGELKNISGKKADRVFIGNGTSSSAFRAAFPVEHLTSDEYGTTLEARKLFWLLHPPRGLMKLVPLSLRTPPRNIDDLAAFAIILKNK